MQINNMQQTLGTTLVRYVLPLELWFSFCCVNTHADNVPLGPIIGGVIGGLAFLIAALLAAALVLLLVYKRKAVPSKCGILVVHAW